jgi:hypothetical protein
MGLLFYSQSLMASEKFVKVYPPTLTVLLPVELLHFKQLYFEGNSFLIAPEILFVKAKSACDDMSSSKTLLPYLFLNSSRI